MLKYITGLFSSKLHPKQTAEAKLFMIGHEALDTARELEIENNDELALKYYGIAVEAGMPEAFRSRAYILQKLDYDFEAIDEFTKGIETSPEDSNMFFGRHLSKWKIGEIEGAIEDIKHAIRLSKANTELNNHYNVEVQKQGYAKVEDFYFSYLRNVELDMNLTPLEREKRRAKRKRRS